MPLLCPSGPGSSAHHCSPPAPCGSPSACSSSPPLPPAAPPGLPPATLPFEVPETCSTTQRSCSSITASLCPAAQPVLAATRSFLVLRLRGRVTGLVSRFPSHLCSLLPNWSESAGDVTEDTLFSHPPACFLLFFMIYTKTSLVLHAFSSQALLHTHRHTFVCAMTALGVAAQRVTWKATGDGCTKT